MAHKHLIDIKIKALWNASGSGGNFMPRFKFFSVRVCRHSNATNPESMNYMSKPLLPSVPIADHLMD
jgi:hypothetical protein